MYILPKKYASASDVKIAEVIKSFPLRIADASAQQINPVLDNLNAQIATGSTNIDSTKQML